jgi:hypothetical protein
VNADEATKLLTVISQFDGRTISTDMAAAWAFALDDVDAQDALLMVREHYRSERRMYPIRPGDLVDMTKVKVEQTRYRIAADVRAARGYGIVSRSWPEKTPLPEWAQVRLLLARTKAMEAAGELEDLSPAVDNAVDNSYGVGTRALE